MATFEGARVGVLEARRGSEMAELVRRLGGEPRSAAAVHEVPHLEHVPAFLDALDEKRFDVAVFLTGVGAPTMLPIPAQNIISRLRAKVDRFQVSREPDWNLMITGRVKSTPVPSPFGPQIGRLLSVTAGFTEGTNATFSLLAGTVSGSHSTTLPLATGVIAFGDDD